MKSKPINPYTALLERARKFERQVADPFQKKSTWFAKQEIEQGSTFKLNHIYGRVEAANDLGFDTHLKATDRGLEVVFVKRPTREFF